MKKLMFIPFIVGAIAAGGCLSITNNIGADAIRAANGFEPSTNASSEASSVYPMTNGTVTVSSSARGGIVIINQANQPKHIAPVTDLSIPSGAF